MTKISICWTLVVLDQNWPKFVYTNLLMQNSIHSGKEIKTIWTKFEKMLLVVHLSFLHAKQLLMKSESLQTYANLLLGLMPANYNLTRWVNPCRPVFIRVGISIQRWVDSHLDKTSCADLKKLSCLISNEQDQNVKLKALQQADRRKLTASVFMGLVLTAAMFLKPWVAFTSSIFVKSCIAFSLKRIFNVVAKRESSMHWDDTIYKRKASWLFKNGSANNGDCTKQPILLKNISENTFLTGVHL